MRLRKWPGLIVLLAALTARADYSNTVMSFHPAAYWQLNETNVPAADKAVNLGTLGTGGDGYYANGITHSMPGALYSDYNTSVFFDGVAGRVAVPYNPVMSRPAPFTVEAWLQLLDSPSLMDYSGALSCVNFTGSGRLGWLIYQNGTRWNLRLGSTNGYTFNEYGTNVISPGEWCHLAFVYTGSNAILYVNGTVDISGPVSSFTPNDAAPFQVGGVVVVEGAAVTERFNRMQADEVAYYTNALSGAEIIRHYQNARDYSPAVSYDQLVLSNKPAIYLRLDEPEFFPEPPPVAANRGSLGTNVNGMYLPGSRPGVAGVSYTGFGANNHGCRFNGIQASVDLGSDTGLNIQGPMTLVAWIKGNPADSRFQCIVGKGDTSWGLVMTAAGLPAFSDGGANPDVTGTASVNDGKWHQLAGVYDGSKLFLYVDGVSNAAVEVYEPVEGSAYFAAMGRAPDSTNRFFAGAVDEVAVFTNALTPAQILQMYLSANVPPVILQGPLSQNVSEGLSFSLNVTAIGTPTLACQWNRNGTNLPGATGTVLTLSNVVAADGGWYAVQVSNAFGVVMSLPAVITIQPYQPVLYRDPQPLSRYTGNTASFSVSVGGTLPMHYQWYVNGSHISGANASNYVIASVQLTNAGDYSCQITNGYGYVNSMSATLTVAEAPTNSYALAVLADSPKSFWRLGEAGGTTAYDYVGGRHGEYAGVVLGQPGYSLLDADAAVAFGPARDSYVGNIQGVNFGAAGSTGAFSVEAWVKCPFGQGGGLNPGVFDAAIVAKGASGGEQFSLDLGNAGCYRFMVRTAAGQIREARSAVAPNNTWQHVVGVCNRPGARLYLYVNGVSQASAVISTSVLSLLDPMTIGSRQSGGAAFDLNLNGVVDEVAIYDYALSATQVAAHFNARYGTGRDPVIGAQPASLTNYVSLPATFTVEAAGTPPLSYQWRFNGTNLPGATGSAHAIASLQPADAGSYSVIVSNASGTSPSDAAQLTVLGVPVSVDVSSGLVLNLKFDGSDLDWSGRENHGTNVGAASFVAGAIGSGAVHYSSDGSSSFNYVTLGTRPDLQFSSNVNFSVAYWIRYPVNDLSGNVPILGNAVGSTCHPGYVFAQNAGAWTWSLGDLSSNVVPAVGISNSVNDGDWHHLAHTFDRAGNAITYLDSVPVDSRPIGRPSGSRIGDVDTGELTNIGQDPTGAYGGHSVSADLDDLGVWQRVLTPLEVAGIYAVGVNHGTSLAPIRIAISTAVGQVQLTWSLGVLQSADEVAGPYVDVSGATSPYPVTPSEPRKFYRLRQ